MNNIETMAFSWEDVTPIIPNTTMRKRLKDGVATYYSITPNEGYALHVKGLDTEVENPETHEVIGIQLGYKCAMITCALNYDFTPVTVTDENGVQFTAYGAREEYFTRPSSDVPADQIYGAGNNHEVM